MQGQKTLMRAGNRHHAQDPVAPGYHGAQEAVSLGLCHCCKQDKELLLFSARAVPLPSHRTILGVSRLGKMWVFPVCFAGARSLSQQKQPQTLGIALSSWRGTAMGISESGKDGYFEHRARLTSSRWLLRAGIERGAPRPSLSLPRPWTVGSVSGPSFASSSSPRRESTQGNYCWSYQKQVLCRFFSWNSARRSAGGHNAWSILALNQKDHRKVDCMVAFTGLGGLRVRHVGEE